MVDISGDVALMANYPDLFTVMQFGGNTNVSGRRFPINEEPGDPSGVCSIFTTTFRLAPNQVATEIRIGDMITDADGTVWTITEISKLSFNGGYFLGCVNLNLDANLKDVINIYTPVFTTDAWADVINTPTPTYPNIACRLQPKASGLGVVATPIPRSAADVGGKKGLTRFFDIYCLIDFDLDYGTIIRNADPADTRVYIFEGQTGRQSIKDFSILHCKVLP